MTISQSQARTGLIEFTAADAAELLARAVIEADPEKLSEHHWQKALLAPLRDFLSRPGREFRGSIVQSAWTIAGRDLREMPETLPMALELLHAGSLIIDDIQDESEMRRGQPALHCLFGAPVALNTGNWLYFAASTLIDNIELPAETKLVLLRRLRWAVLRCHQGQALDLTARISTLGPEEIGPIVSATTSLKTASLVELAACLGATAAGAPDHLIKRLESFGQALGTALQTLDDLSGILSDRREDKGDEDLRGGRPTWVWVFAAEASSRSALTELLQMAARVEQGGAPDELRERLRVCLPVDAKARVTRRLDEAYRKLCAGVPPSAGLDGLRDLIERLEMSYV
jgi:geranylgeranyl pyrophosphate synthase